MPVLFIGFIIGLIVSAFVAVGSAIVSVLAVVVPIFVQVFGVIKFVVLQIATNAGRFFRFIVGAVRTLYERVLVPIADAARRYYDKFKAFLQRVFDPIIKIFEEVQRILNKIWDKIIAPILSALDKVRAVLKLLAVLGVPFAERLERILQRIQREIFTRFQQIQQWVNTATFWLDLLLDPRGWIRSTPFLYTVFRYAGNIVNIVTKLADRSGFHRETLTQARRENPPKGVDVTVERVKTGEIRNSAAVQSAAARFRSGQSGRLA